MNMQPSEHLMELARRFAYSEGTGELLDATRAARTRTGVGIGTQCKQGLFRVVRTDYGKKVTVTPLSEWIRMDRAIAFLETLCAS